KVAVLVEPRAQDALVPLLMHFAAALNNDWGFHVFNSPKNDALLRESLAITRMIDSGKLRITNIPSDTHLEGPVNISRFLTKPWIWEQLRPEQENILFFQTDSILCTRSKQSPEDFFDYDFVGAPWPWSESGGNGGLSLRKRSMTLKVIKGLPFTDDDSPEDGYYSTHIPLAGGKVATKDVARHFSVEHVFQSRPLGIH
ncbi:hypothetical protein BDK51DRAFT_9280, partial [Blyttiomyces helicus]